MTNTNNSGLDAVPARRVEILVDQPLLRRVEDVAADAGVTAFTVRQTLSGSDKRGRWRDDRVTGGAGSRLVFIAFGDEASIDRLIEALRPLIVSHSLTVAISDSTVIGM